MEKVKLSNFIKQIRGVSYKPEDIRNESDKNAIPILRANNITADGHIDLNDIVYVDSKKVQNEQLLRSGDIFICASSGSKNLVGKAVYIPTDMPYAFGAFCKVVRPVSENIDKHYLAQFFQSPSYRKKISDLAQGANINNIKNEHIDELDIAIYSLEEQKAIAEKLDKVSGLIEKRKTQLKKLDLLIKSRFIEMFGDPVSNPLGWEKKTLKEVCVKLNDGTHFSPESFEVGEYKYVTAKNIKMSGFDFSNITYVPEEVHRPIYERCNPELGDVLYIKDGVTTGIAMVNTLEEEFTLLSSVALLKQDRRIMNGHFLTALLNNESMYTDIRSNMGGAAITRLTIAKLNAIKVIVPSIELQEQFAYFVEQVDKSKFQIQKSLEKLEILKKSLMQQYFG